MAEGSLGLFDWSLSSAFSKNREAISECPKSGKLPAAKEYAPHAGTVLACQGSKERVLQFGVDPLHIYVCVDIYIYIYNYIYI